MRSSFIPSILSRARPMDVRSGVAVPAVSWVDSDASTAVLRAECLKDEEDAPMAAEAPALMLSGRGVNRSRALACLSRALRRE